MTNYTVAISAFSPPEQLWTLLEEGCVLTFKEYDQTGIPPDYIQLGKLDLETRWKAYSRSLHGLLSALVDNAERLVRWRYMSWSGSTIRNPREPKMDQSYFTLVNSYSGVIAQCMHRYYGINRIIEAGTLYSYFLCDEAYLLAGFRQEHVVGWQDDFQRKVDLSKAQEADVCPVDYSQDPDIIERKEGYCIKRVASSFSGSGLRYSIVYIYDIGTIGSDELKRWLNAGYHVEYKSVTLSGVDEDGHVIGTDAYGLDFYAGEITRPADIAASIQCQDENDTQTMLEL